MICRTVHTYQTRVIDWCVINLCAFLGDNRNGNYPFIENSVEAV